MSRSVSTQLPPRDLSPPPLPPRSWVRHPESAEATPEAHQTEFITTDCSDEVELRRPSARGAHHHPNTCDMAMMSTAAASSCSHSANSSPGTSLQLINSSLIMRRRSSAMERAPRNPPEQSAPPPATAGADHQAAGPPLIPYVNTRNNHSGPIPPAISRRTR